MRFTLQQYEKLKEGITNGVRSIQYGDKTVTYHSMNEMIKLLEIMEEDLFPERFGRRRKLAETDRGYFNSKI
jgi:hypothetical protein